jgi:uncharacterized protein (TIGR03083 family)
MLTTTQLGISRVEAIEGMLREYEAFAALVGALNEAEWTSPSRCERFEVRDVAGHVIGLAEDVVAGQPGARTAEEEAASVRHDTPTTAAARLTAALDTLRTAIAPGLDDDTVWDGPSGVDGLTMGEGVVQLWYDTYVHADDIRDALGWPTETGPGERAALVALHRELQRRGFGPARIELVDRTLPILEIGTGGGGAVPTHRVRAHELILAATGRLDAASVGLDPSIDIYAD